MSPSPTMGRRLPSRRRTVLGLAAVALVAGAAALALLRWTPSFYARTRDTGPERDAIARFNRGVVNHVSNVLLDESGGTPLDLVVDEAMVNARLALALEELERDGARPAPAFRLLRVAFEPGSVVLATRLGQGMAAVVVWERLDLAATSDGRLRVRVVGAGVGLMPVPMWPADEALAGALERGIGGWGGVDGDGVRAFWRAVATALEGEPVSLAGRGVGVHLEAIEIERGRLRARGRRVEGDG